jgi:hypothetical protein
MFNCIEWKAISSNDLKTNSLKLMKLILFTVKHLKFSVCSSSKLVFLKSRNKFKYFTMNKFLEIGDIIII